ncbi:MAG TPA: alpha/beta hydrolase [Usitatibacter sp.]|nr:alpha/beta hydrolase [Usitatibacter sp.]
MRTSLGIASAVAPARATETASRLFTTPPRIPHTARELELLSTGAPFRVRGPHGEIAAWRFGARGRPVVLLSHGWGGRGAQLRAFVPALLGAGYQPVLFDHPGHGHSDGRESTLVHFVGAIDAVVRALEEEGERIAGIVGHSLGAAAAGAWLNQTRREIAAILVAPPTSLQRYSGYFARKLGIPERIRRAMQEGFERKLGQPWRDFELPHSVAAVRARALVVHDAGDREVAFASGLALARAWPGARLVRTEGLGHRAIVRDPAVVRDAIDFLDKRVVFAPPPAPGEWQAFAAPAPAF